MRIISGELKGRSFSPRRRPGLRPTGDRVREAIFSMLQSEYDLEGWKVLDLYAGSGGLGLEAVSRGAASAMFLEADRISVADINAACKAFGIESRARAIAAQLPAILRAPPHQLKSFAPYDLVFADPPYLEHPGLSLSAALQGGELVRQGTVFVIESSRREPLSSAIDSDEALKPMLQKEKVYGDTRVSIFEFC